MCGEKLHIYSQIFNGCTVVVWEWICNFITPYWPCEIYLSMLGLILIQASKMGPGRNVSSFNEHKRRSRCSTYRTITGGSCGQRWHYAQNNHNSTNNCAYFGFLYIKYIQQFNVAYTNSIPHKCLYGLVFLCSVLVPLFFLLISCEPLPISEGSFHCHQGRAMTARVPSQITLKYAGKLGRC